MKLDESLLTELGMEASTTRRMLERISGNSLSWKPHEKSRTLGDLASHIIRIPALFIVPLHQPAFDCNRYSQGDTSSVAAIVAQFDQCIVDASAFLRQLSSDELMCPGDTLSEEPLFFDMPRIAVIRGMEINHLMRLPSPWKRRGATETASQKKSLI
jgi:DinB superfamily